MSPLPFWGWSNNPGSSYLNQRGHMLFHESATHPFAFILLALLVAGFPIVVYRVLLRRRNMVSFRHLRGRALKTVAEVRASLAARSLAHGVQLGMHLLPHRVAYGHFAIVGATGSGKTLLQRLLMQSVLPRIGTGLEQRALIYDAKQDVLSLLAGMGLRCPVWTLHPFDARGVAWDMAGDITSPAAALQAATLLMPKAQNDANPFFSNAARHLLYGVVLALMLKAPARWSLRQVLLVLRSEPLLRQVLGQSEFTRPLLQYCEHATTFQNILSTLLTRTAPYEIIAAAWDKAERRLSLREWLGQESILVLANDEDNRAAIDTMNQLIFKRLSELVLAGEELPEESLRTTWFFLDEVRQAGRLEGLSALMTKGRSKGAAVLLGFQDIHGLHEVYGREAANELVGQCNTKALLRLNSPETARWASQLFGSSEFLESRRSRSRSRNFRELGGPSGGSSGEAVSNGIAKRELVLDSEFLDLPETSFDNGVTGFFLNPLTGAFKDHLPSDWLRQHLRPPHPATPNLIRRPESHQFLRPWSDQDALDLGLTAVEGVSWAA